MAVRKGARRGHSKSNSSPHSSLLILGLVGSVLCIGLFAFLATRPSGTSEEKAVKAYVGGTSDLAGTEKTSESPRQDPDPSAKGTEDRATPAIPDRGDTAEKDEGESSSDPNSSLAELSPVKGNLQEAEDLGHADATSATSGFPEDWGIPEDSAVEGAPAERSDETYARRLAEAKQARDSDLLKSLADWCRANGMADKSKEVYRAILEFDPNHREAREALGYVSVRPGLWVEEAQAESYGLFRHEGRWWRRDELERRGLVLRAGQWVAPGPETAQPGTTQPGTAVETKKKAEPAVGEPKWHSFYEMALREASQRKTLVFAKVFSDGCTWCRKLDQETLKSPLFQQAAPYFVLLEIDETKDRAFCEKYRVQGFPAMILMDARGKEIDRMRGFVEISALAPFLQKIVGQNNLSLPKVGQNDAGNAGRNTLADRLQRNTSSPDGFVGKKAPEFAPTGTYNSDGRHSLAAHRGDLLVVEEFQVQCGPCRSAIPHLNQIQAQFGGKGLSLLSMTSDSEKEVLSLVLHNRAIGYKVFTQAKVTAQFPGKHVPHCYVIDPEGYFLWQGSPQELNPKKIQEFLQKRSRFFVEIFPKAPRSALARAVAGDWGEAYEIAEKAVDATKKEEDSEVALELKIYLKGIVEQHIYGAKHLFDQGDYLASRSLYRKWHRQLKDSSFGDALKQKLDAFESEDVKEEIRKLEMLDRFLAPYLRDAKRDAQLIAAAKQLAAMAQGPLSGSSAARFAQRWAMGFAHSENR